MAKGLFVTATGTDIGKTYVSGLLVKKMREYGYNCGYYKPVLSGGGKYNGKLIPGDCVHVVKTAGLDIEPFKCLSYCFEDAVSPHLAAKRAGVNIDINKIK
nr:dethiobiotin synthase [Cyanobacteria bacterium RUI128]